MRKFLTAIILLLLLAPAGHAQNTITTVAGGVPENENAVAVGLGTPYAIAMDSAGNLYIADSVNSSIYEVNLLGQLSTVAGIGANGFSGDGGPATSAELLNPGGLFVDGSGNIFIADSNNNRIREVGGPNNTTIGPGVIVTVAGNGTAGYSGDNGPATAAELNINSYIFGNGPTAISVDASGDIFIADVYNGVIRVVGGPDGYVLGNITVKPGFIQTIAGGGFGCGNSTSSIGDGCVATSASLYLATGVFVDGSGNIFIADTDYNLIREVGGPNNATIGPGVIQTVAGNLAAGYGGDNGPATSAELNSPSSVFVDGFGNIFIADSYNSVIREVGGPNNTAIGPGVIVTVAGNGTYGFSGGGGPATSAQLSNPDSVSVDSFGNIFIADTSNGVVREVVAETGIIRRAAGNGSINFSGDGVPATNAELSFPSSVFPDSSGNIFIADTSNNLIREVIAATGKILTVAGNGTAGFNGDNGPATSQELNIPNAVFLDSFGNIFIADTYNNRIREVVAATGIIQTVAGNGHFGFSGDGGPATSAELYSPLGLFVDAFGNIFIADSENNRIREVGGPNNTTIGPGVIQTIAGNGTGGDGGPAINAALVLPYSVFVDGSGNIFIADTFDNSVREVGGPNNTTIGPGIIQTVAGNKTAGYNGNDITATSAELNQPTSVFVDGSGNMFISDTGNARIREVGGPNNTTIGPGVIANVAGNGTFGYSGDGGPATSAEVSPIAVWGDLSGNLLIADSGNDRIRSVAGLTSAPIVSFSPATLPLTTGQTGSIIVTNSGAAPLVISGISLTGANPSDFIFGGSTTCPLNGDTLAAQASCTLSIGSSPSLQSSGTAAISVTDNAANSPQSVQISVSTLPIVSFQPQSLTLNAVGAPQNIDLTNTGPVPLLISSIALTGANPAAFALGSATTCPLNGGALAAQATCILSISLGAASQGSPASASLTVTDNAANPTQSVPLSGSALILTSNGPFTMSRGQTLSVNLELLGPPSTVSYNLACAGSPSGLIVSCLPSSVAGPNQTFAVTISATTSSFALPVSPASWNGVLLCASFATLLSLFWVISVRRKIPIQSRIYAHSTIAVLCLLAVALSSCATGGISQQASVGTVTPGAYTVTVTATPSNSSGNLTATFPLTIN
jgi:hypothetical protein